MKTETQLVQMATFHEDDSVANACMKELRIRFDSTYGWCTDCDGAVVRESGCCLNRITKDIISDDIVEFYF